MEQFQDLSNGRGGSLESRISFEPRFRARHRARHVGRAAAEPPPVPGCVPRDLTARLGRGADRSGATVEGAMEDAPTLRPCHLHSPTFPRLAT